MLDFKKCKTFAAPFSKLGIIKNVYLFEGFLSEEECDEWVSRAEKAGFESHHYCQATHKYFYDKIETAAFSDTANQLAKKERIPFELTVPYIAVNKYENGDKYNWHFDRKKFEENVSGERMATMVINLGTSEDFVGTGTEFYRLPQIDTKKGDLLIFDPTLMHRAAPSTAGRRFSLSAWAVID